MLKVGIPLAGKALSACPGKIKEDRCFISGCIILFFVKMKSRMQKK